MSNAITLRDNSLNVGSMRGLGQAVQLAEEDLVRLAEADELSSMVSDTHVKGDKKQSVKRKKMYTDQPMTLNQLSLDASTKSGASTIVGPFGKEAYWTNEFVGNIRRFFDGLSTMGVSGQDGNCSIEALKKKLAEILTESGMSPADVEETISNVSIDSALLNHSELKMIFVGVSELFSVVENDRSSVEEIDVKLQQVITDVSSYALSMDGLAPRDTVSASLEKSGAASAAPSSSKPSAGISELFKYLMQVLFSQISISKDQSKLNDLTSSLSGSTVKLLQESEANIKANLDKLQKLEKNLERQQKVQKGIAIVGAVLTIIQGIVTRNPAFIFMGVYSLAMEVSGGQEKLDAKLDELPAAARISTKFGIALGMALAARGAGGSKVNTGSTFAMTLLMGSFWPDLGGSIAEPIAKATGGNSEKAKQIGSIVGSVLGMLIAVVSGLKSSTPSLGNTADVTAEGARKATSVATENSSTLVEGFKKSLGAILRLGKKGSYTANDLSQEMVRFAADTGKVAVENATKSSGQVIKAGTSVAERVGEASKQERYVEELMRSRLGEKGFDLTKKSLSTANSAVNLAGAGVMIAEGATLSAQSGLQKDQAEHRFALEVYQGVVEALSQVFTRIQNGFKDVQNQYGEIWQNSNKYLTPLNPNSYS